MLTCNYFKNELSTFLDNELTESQRRKLLSHLNQCPECEKELDELRQNNIAISSHFINSRNSIDIQGMPAFTEIMQSARSEAKSDNLVLGGKYETKKQLNIIYKMKMGFLNLKNSFSNYEEMNEIEISTSGEAVSHHAVRLVPALLAALGILLLFAPKLNALILMS